jgi:transposase
VLCVETIGKIRRRRLVKQDTISGIARDLGLSRNTVKKALRTGGEPFEYRRERQPRPQLGPYLGLLEQWLEADAKLPGRERRSAQRLYEMLRIEGYAGAVDSVRRHVRQYQARTQPTEAFIPQSFGPGEAYQFDWSHEHVELGGQSQVVKVAHLRLCHSRAFLVTAFPRETQEMVFEAHARAFAHLGGIPRRGIYDNMKTAIDAIFVGRERRYNRRFLAMCSHYLIEPTACTPASGWEKGQVENQVGTVRGWLFTPKPRFASLAELNAWLAERCIEIARERRHPEQAERTIAEVWAEERAALQPVMAPFDGFHERSCRVSSTALVSFERNRYSVNGKATFPTRGNSDFPTRLRCVVVG